MYSFHCLLKDILLRCRSHVFWTHRWSYMYISFPVLDYHQFVSSYNFLYLILSLNKHLLIIWCISLSKPARLLEILSFSTDCQETHLFMMRRMMMIMTIMIRTCSGKFCLETTSLIRPIGTTFQIQVQYYKISGVEYIYGILIKSVTICIAAKSLVACLMDVDQDQRLTAQEAINHEW